MSIRTALTELRAGSLTPPEEHTGIAWGTVTGTRVVLRPWGEVVRIVDDLARRNLLTLRRHHADEAVWTRSGGVGASVARKLGGRRRHPLAAVRELRCTLVEQVPGSGRQLVRVDGSLVFPWRLLRLRSQVVVVAGVGGGLGALLLGLENLGDPQVIDAIAGVVTVGAGSLGVRAYRDAVVRTERALDAFLDRLEHDAPWAVPALPTS